jgi:hypothetical protein
LAARKKKDARLQPGPGENLVTYNTTMASPSGGIPSNAATEEVCSGLARLPINRGLMIALNDDDDRLILHPHPQDDANLPMFHQNIYVPK